MEEKKNKNMVVIIIILCLLLVGAVGFIVYDKAFRTNQNNNNQGNEEIQEQQKLEISETEVKKLYYNIFNNGKEEAVIIDEASSDSGFSLIHSFYTDKKSIIRQDISYGDLMSIAYNKIPESKIEENRKILLDGGVQITQEFLVSDIKEAYKFYFGENNEWKDFETGYPLGKCSINGERYNCECDVSGFGDVASSILFLTSYDKYETDKENVYIYEKAIYFDSEGNKFYHKYNNGGLETEVEELRGKDKTTISNGEYRDKLLGYKHAFKQNTDGTFYLYSTEPILENN